MNTIRRPILILGLTAAGAAGLPAALQHLVAQASLLAGGERHLAAFPDFSGERLCIGATVESAIVRLSRAWEDGERAVVLASGDPLWYGIGATLRRTLPSEALEIIPAPTAAQLAFAALAEPWHDAVLLSAHGRPLAPAIAAALAAPKAAILTDGYNTPAIIAAALLEAGLLPDTDCAICENLGGSDQRVVRTSLGNVAEHNVVPLNVFIVWPRRQITDQAALAQQAPTVLQSDGGQRSALLPGLPDEAFSTEAGQITKREIRLLSLTELALGPGEVLWDIGAGSGSISIEAARAQPTAQVFAAERRALFVRHAYANLERFPAANLHIVHGEAPAICAAWPDPHAIFIGGSGGFLTELIDLADRRLRPGGRLVLNLVILEHLHTVAARLPMARVAQIQVSRSTPIQSLHRLEALNPLFLVVWRKEDSHG